MGYGVTVDLPHHRKEVTFSHNISHASMRHTADAITDVLYDFWQTPYDGPDADFYSLPTFVFEAVCPGLNGTRMEWTECLVDAPKMRALVPLFAGHPQEWVVQVLALALTHAAANGGSVHFS